MINRKKFIVIYLSVYVLLSFTIYFSLKIYSHQQFNPQSLEHLISGKSKFRDVTNDLCHYQILGDPDVGQNYIKINFWCLNGTKARSTFALSGFEDKTFTGIIKEYSRIINFDVDLIAKNNWYCTLNDKEINFIKSGTLVPNAATIDCYEKKGIKKSD